MCAKLTKEQEDDILRRAKSKLSNMSFGEYSDLIAPLACLHTSEYGWWDYWSRSFRLDVAKKMGVK